MLILPKYYIKRQAFLVLMMVFPESKHFIHYIYGKTSLGKLKLRKKKGFDFRVLMLAKQSTCRIHIALSKIILTFLDIIQTFCMEYKIMNALRPCNTVLWQHRGLFKAGFPPLKSLFKKKVQH